MSLLFLCCVAELRASMSAIVLSVGEKINSVEHEVLVRVDLLSLRQEYHC